jgi:hypothetical protein
MAPDPSRRREPFALLAVGAAGKDQVLGNHLVLEDLFVVVYILDERVEGEDALFQPAFDLLPVVPGDDAGDDVEGHDLFGALIAAVDVEGDAHFEQQGLGRLLAHGSEILSPGGQRHRSIHPPAVFGHGFRAIRRRGA